MLLQNVDAKKAPLFEKRQQVAPLIHANEHQKRIERNRSERIRRHAVRLLRPARSRNDGNARGKLPESMPKICRRERSSSHIRSFSRYHTATREAKKAPGLEGEKSACKFAFLRASAHHRRQNGHFHAQRADGAFLRRVAAIDHKRSREISVKL